jgi:GTPase SAR1 family protein
MRSNYKAAICGAHSQGKTTLVKALKDNIFLDEKQFSYRTNLTRSLKELNIPINESGTSMTQYLVMARHLEYSLTPGNWILDRGALDGIAYTDYFYEKGQISREIYDAAIEVYKECLSRYDRIFYVVPELNVKEDGERSTGKEFFDGVVKQFDFFIKHHSMAADKLVYVMGTVEERTKIVLDTIKKDFTNEL